MAGEELQVVRLRDDFYRDGFYKVLLAVATIIVAIVLLIIVSLYLLGSKPKPVYFSTDNEWRVLAPVPVEQQYLKNPDLAQWVTNVLPQAFTYDFISYTKQLKNLGQYFTANGWQIFLNQLNIYANYNGIQTQKLFVSASAAGAPVVINQGLLQGRYAWWVQMPVNLNYISADKGSTQPLVIQVLVVRVPTLNNISGVGIENMIVSKGDANQVVRANG